MVNTTVLRIHVWFVGAKAIPQVECLV